jgi:hypothetical protein
MPSIGIPNRCGDKFLPINVIHLRHLNCAIAGLDVDSLAFNDCSDALCGE